MTEGKRRLNTTPRLSPPGVDIDLLPMLACPECQRALEMSDEEGRLLCLGCGRGYPIIDGIPHLRIEGPAEAATGISAEERYISISSQVKRWVGRHTWIYRLLWRLYPMPVRNSSARRVFSRLVEHLPSQGLVLNVGSGEVLGGGMEILYASLPGQIVNLDIYPCPRVGVVADAHRLPFQAGSLDLIVLKCILEHVRKPEQVVGEARRVLKAGGFIYSETPFVSRFHGDTDYKRWTLMGLDELFQDFQRLESGVCAGPGSAIGLALREFIACFSQNRFLHPALKFIASWLTFHFKYLDIILVKKKFSFKLAQSLYFLGQKSFESSGLSVSRVP